MRMLWLALGALALLGCEAMRPPLQEAEHVPSTVAADHSATPALHLLSPSPPGFAGGEGWGEGDPRKLPGASPLTPDPSPRSGERGDRSSPSPAGFAGGEAAKNLISNHDRM